MDVALRKHCQKRKAALLAERSLYEPDWRQVADYVDPYAGRYLTQQKGTRKLPSRNKIINSTATKALRTMDAGFMGGHTSKSRPWFRLGVSDPKVNDAPGVRAWLDDVTQLIRDVLARSNFYTELPDFYHERHLFGVGALMCEADDDTIVRFYQRSIGTYAIGLDSRGRCDSFWYGFEWTAHQIDQHFTPIIGKDKLPRKVTEALALGKPDDKFWIDCLIEPNPDYKKDSRAGAERKFRQVYWMEGQDTDTHGCLDYQGRYNNNVLASRWGANGFDVYGPSPALDALGDIKQLQYLEGEKLRLFDLTSKPPLSLPESLRHKGASMAPGALLYVTPMQVAHKVEPIYVPHATALREAREEVLVVAERVEEAFFADLFRMLDFLDDRQRTAYEISERKEEKVAMLGPALESLTDEVLDPAIDLAFFELDERGLIPAIPDAMRGLTIKVEYTSALAQAAKAAGTGTIERVLMTATQLAAGKGGDMSVWDKIDTDFALEAIHDSQGAPARMLRTDDEVAAIRGDRQQAQQRAEMAAQMPAMKQGAEAMKTLGEAEAKDGSMLQNLAGAQAEMA